MRGQSRRFQDHINFFNYAIDSIFTYKARSIAIVFSLMIALMILGSVAFISDGLTREAESSANFAPDITIQYLQSGRQVAIPMEYARQISQIPNVDKVVPRVWGYIYYHNRIYTVMGIDSINMPIPKDIGFIMVSGSFLQQNDSQRAVVGNYLAKTFDLEINDILVLYDQSQRPHNFTVNGIFSMEVNLYTSDLILINLNDSRDFFNVSPEEATDLCVYVEDQAQTRYVAQQIAQSFPDARVLTREAMKDALLSTYGARSGFVSVVWYILLLSVILVAWNQASAVSEEARKEVGILKALGFSTSNILEIRLLEALVLGFISASFGIFLSVLYDSYLGAPIIRDFMLGWAAVYPSFPLPILISFSALLTLYAVALFPLLIGSLIPAWKSATTEPDIAMRGS